MRGELEGVGCARTQKKAGGFPAGLFYGVAFATDFGYFDFESQNWMWSRTARSLPSLVQFKMK